MRSFTILALCALVSLSSSAQKIHFTDSANVWKYFTCSIDVSLTESTGTQHYIKDTLISGRKYRWLGSSFVREDTIAGIVYIKYNNTMATTVDTSDQVLYNYNWHAGDTVKNHQLFSSPTVSWVTSVDSTQINGLWYKLWHFAGFDSGITIIPPFTYQVIEGIGCTNGFDYPANPYGAFEVSHQLICFTYNGNTDSLSYAVPSWGLAGPINFNNSSSCDIHPVEVKTLPGNSSASIFPNPINENSRIAFPYIIESGRLTVINEMGQTVFNIPIYNKEELLIGNSVRVPGIYYYRVTDNGNGKTFSGKFISY